MSFNHNDKVLKITKNAKSNAKMASSKALD